MTELGDASRPDYALAWYITTRSSADDPPHRRLTKRVETYTLQTLGISCSSSFTLRYAVWWWCDHAGARTSPSPVEPTRYWRGIYLDLALIFLLLRLSLRIRFLRHLARIARLRLNWRGEKPRREGVIWTGLKQPLTVQTLLLVKGKTIVTKQMENRTGMDGSERNKEKTQREKRCEGYRCDGDSLWLHRMRQIDLVQRQTSETDF